ncbi:MAG TPA: hypothetical protein GXX29_01270 [Firmicutes bacterium]|nr:hypothetical protein [Bacillota bacterium]
MHHHPNQAPSYGAADLRWAVGVVVKRWRMIAVFIIFGALLAMAANYLFLTPKYRVEQGLAIPYLGEAGEFGLTYDTYIMLALSNTVMQEVAALPQFQGSLLLARGVFAVGYQDSYIEESRPTRILLATVTMDDPEAAYNTAVKWRESFFTEVESYITRQLERRLQVAVDVLEQRRREYEETRERLAKSEQQIELAMVEKNLELLLGEYDRLSTRVTDLVEVIMPAEKARAKAIEETLAGESMLLSEGLAGSIQIPTMTGAVAVLDQLSLVNPVYLSLKEELARVQASLAGYEQTVSSGQKRLAALKTEIDRLQERAIQLRKEYDQLREQVELARGVYLEAKREYDRLLVKKENLQVETQPKMVNPPMVPETTTGSFLVFIVVFAAFLAMVMGLALAFAIEAWRSQGMGQGAGPGTTAGSRAGA